VDQKSPPIVGEVFTDVAGIRLRVVNKFQQKQKQAYWVHEMSREQIHSIFSGSHWRYEAWTVNAATWPTHLCLSLCPETELDPPETNEFGLVVP
jgi:hypothetical protein